MQLERVTVVICTLGRPSLLRAIESVADGDCRALAELIVVDNTPGGLGLFMAGFGIPIRIVSGHRVLSIARNIGIAAASTDVVLFTDDDCEPNVDWVLTSAVYMAKAKAVAAAFGRVIPSPRRGTQILDRPIEGVGVAAWAEAGDAYCPAVSSPSWSPGPAGRVTVPWAVVGSSNNLSIRRSALASPRPFRAEFGAGSPALSAEDTEFGYSLMRAGRRVDFCATATVTHNRWLAKQEWERLHDRYAHGNVAVLESLARAGDDTANTLLISYHRFLVSNRIKVHS